MGPFYCPTDQKIYIDPSFFDELTRRFGAPGDFAQAYVIAHEVGHHVQNLEGKLGGGSNSNEQQVAIELQADCYAGVWAARARDAQGQLLEPGDVEEGMRAAEAIGDDTLQRQAQGVVVPESFTHGSSAQRMEALRRGLQTGNPGAVQLFGLSRLSHAAFAPPSKTATRRVATGRRTGPLPMTTSLRFRQTPARPRRRQGRSIPASVCARPMPRPSPWPFRLRF